MPRPEFGPDDYENPDAPEAEQRLRAHHPAVRDLSYDEGRARQYLDLWKQSLVEISLDPWEGTDPQDRHDAEPAPSLELFVKERPRGRGYVCDFVYREAGLPVAVYGTLVNEGHGLIVNELELWRGGVTGGWEYRDAWGDYVGPDADHDDAHSRPYSGISSSVLRRIRWAASWRPRSRPLLHAVGEPKASSSCPVACWWPTTSPQRHWHCWSAPMTTPPRSVVAGHPLLTTSLSGWPGPTWKRRPPALVLPAASRAGSVVPSRPCATGSLPPATVGTCHPPALVAAAPPLVLASKARLPDRTMTLGDLRSVSGYSMGPASTRRCLRTVCRNRCPAVRFRSEIVHVRRVPDATASVADRCRSHCVRLSTPPPRISRRLRWSLQWCRRPPLAPSRAAVSTTDRLPCRPRPEYLPLVSAMSARRRRRTLHPADHRSAESR
jgi:hypothetical protein